MRLMRLFIILRRDVSAEKGRPFAESKVVRLVCMALRRHKFWRGCKFCLMKSFEKCFWLCWSLLSSFSDNEGRYYWRIWAWTPLECYRIVSGTLKIKFVRFVMYRLIIILEYSIELYLKIYIKRKIHVTNVYKIPANPTNNKSIQQYINKRPQSRFKCHTWSNWYKLINEKKSTHPKHDHV